MAYMRKGDIERRANRKIALRLAAADEESDQPLTTSSATAPSSLNEFLAQQQQANPQSEGPEPQAVFRTSATVPFDLPAPSPDQPRNLSPNTFKGVDGAFYHKEHGSLDLQAKLDRVRQVMRERAELAERPDLRPKAKRETSTAVRMAGAIGQAKTKAAAHVTNVSALVKGEGEVTLPLRLQPISKSLAAVRGVEMLRYQKLNSLDKGTVAKSEELADMDKAIADLRSEVRSIQAELDQLKKGRE